MLEIFLFYLSRNIIIYIADASLLNPPLKDQLAVRIGELREDVSELVHELAAGENGQADLDPEDLEPVGVVRAQGEEQPGGHQR